MASNDVNTTVTVVESSDGHKADLVIVRPRGPKLNEKTPVLLIHPALGVAGAYYHKLAEALAARESLVVVVQEQRGQGSSSWRASSNVDWSYWTPVALDFHLHLEIVRNEFAHNPIFILGHSVGGILWSLWLGKQFVEKNYSAYDAISGLMSIASGSIHYTIHPTKTLLPYSYFVATMCYLLGWWPGERFNFGSPSEAKSFMLDWVNNIWTGNWQSRDCNIPNITHSFRKLQKPVLFITIDSDTFTPPVCAATFAAHFDPKLTRMMVIKAEEEPELKGLAGDTVHIRWARTGVMIPHIASFIQQHINQAPPVPLAKL